jgi:M6 family metalloprotease-like protein
VLQHIHRATSNNKSLQNLSRFLWAFLLSLSPVLGLMRLQTARAAPANPHTFPLTQPDGTQFEVIVIGDETWSAIETLDGFTLLPDDATGYWTYATLDKSGHLVAGDLRVGINSPTLLRPHLRPNHSEFKTHQHETLPPASTNQTRYNGKGDQPLLAILVQFTNQAPVGTSPPDWVNFFFGPTNSVQHYYKQTSYNQLNLTPARETFGEEDDGVVGWVTLPYPHPNSSGVNETLRKVAKDAIAAADAYIDFASFDADGDGYVKSSELHIAFIYAGYEGSFSGGPALACGNQLWAHRANLAEFVKADGVTVLSSLGRGGYAAAGEWHCATNSGAGHPATLGPMVHELGHDLGLPDLYDIEPAGSPSSYGVGNWSVMGTGSWNFVPGTAYGASPAHQDPFSKSYLGWLTPTQLVDSQTTLVIAPSATTAQVIQLRDNPGGIDWEFRYASGSGEYFLVENRQKLGYDAGLPGCGLLIWHINEVITYTNFANAIDTKRLVDLEEADGRNDLDNKTNPGDVGDAFTSTARFFGQFSKPSSALYSGQSSGVTVTNILPESVGCPSGSITSHASHTVAQPQGMGVRADFVLPGPSVPPTAVPGPVITPTLVPTATPTITSPLSEMPFRSYLPLTVR